MSLNTRKDLRKHRSLGGYRQSEQSVVCRSHSFIWEPGEVSVTTENGMHSSGCVTGIGRVSCCVRPLQCMKEASWSVLELSTVWICVTELKSTV